MSFLLNKQPWLLPFLFFLSISGLLVFSWFRFGFIYGGGDVGLQTYNPPRILEIARYIWWEATAPGFPTPQGLTAIPFNLMFSSLSLLGFTPLMFQITLFFLILLAMGLGMYQLILFLFGQDYRRYAILGGLFYLFNPYMMIQVWHRFVHSTFFISAALPFLIIFWLKWIRNRDSTSLLIFLLINLVALYGFGTLAYILTLWFLLFLITIPEIIFPWLGFNNAKKVLALFFIGFIFWLLTNSWWILPISKIAPSFLSEQHSNEETIATLYTLGYQTVLPYSLQMINPFYLFSQLDFGGSYKSVFMRLIPWIFVAVIFVGLVRGVFYAKSANWSVIYLLVLIFSKGVASPLGYFYVFGMKHFFPLGVLRNPFEKVGVLLPLISSILLVIGTKIIFDFLKTRVNIKILKVGLIVTFIIVFYFCWPMFTGQIFGKIDKPGFVEVPRSYTEANLWIQSDYVKDSVRNPGKILHLPLTKGESISYNWEHGYSGLEPSALFFTSAPSISHGFNLKQVDDSLTVLYHVFHKPFRKPNTILRLLQNFNVRYIVLHKDAKWEGGEFYDPKQTEEILNNLDFFEPSQKYGELIIYKVSDKYFESKISFADNFDWSYPPNFSSFWPWILSEDRTLITDINKNNLDILSTNTLIFPKKPFTYTEASSSSTILLINQLVLNQSYDNLWLDPLTRLKKVYRSNNEIQGEELNDKLISASKKLLKISRSIFIENKALSIVDLEDYADEMKQIFSSNSAILSYYARDKAISNIFQVHLYMLKVIANKFQQNNKDVVVKIGDDLKKSLIKNNFISSDYSESKSSDLPEKLILKFDIPKDSNYELLFISPNERDIYQDKYKNMISIIDGKIEYLSGKKTGNIVSFGQISLTAGVHELSLPVLYSDNLISNKEGSSDTVKIDSVDNKIGYIENNIDYVVGGDNYQIDFSAKVEKGNGFYIQLLQDTDTIGENSQSNYQINQFISQTQAQDWVNYSFPLPTLRAVTKNAAVRFLVVPSNNQNSMFSTILIRNLMVVRLFSEDILLRKFGEYIKSSSTNTAMINQTNPVLYNGKFHIEKPAFVIFKETYHPSWKLTLTKDGRVSVPSAHFLANLYANAWYINEAGNYDFKLEFEPQKIVNYGLLAAIISYIGLVLFNIFFRLKGNEKN